MREKDLPKTDVVRNMDEAYDQELMRGTPYGMDEIEERMQQEEICNYTGEACHGDPKFCEECDVVLEDLKLG